MPLSVLSRTKIIPLLPLHPTPLEYTSYSLSTYQPAFVFSLENDRYVFLKYFNYQVYFKYHTYPLTSIRKGANHEEKKEI